MHKNEGTCAEMIPLINIIGNSHFSAKLQITQPLIHILIIFIVSFLTGEGEEIQ